MLWSVRRVQDVANLSRNAIRNLNGSGLDRGRERRASVKACSLDSVNDDLFRSEVQNARKLDGLGDPEGMAGCEREIGRQRLFGEVDPVDTPWRAPARGGVHKNHGVEACPILDQGHHIPAADDKPGFSRKPARKLLRYERPNPVIAAIRVTDSRHENSRPRLSRLA